MCIKLKILYNVIIELSDKAGVSLHYRQAEQDDREKIKEVLVRSFSPTYAYYAQKSFADLQNVLVAEEEGKVTAVINWRILEAGEKKIGYLFWLAVQPEYRRRGIAKELIRAAISKMLQESTLTEIYAAVEKSNAPSRELIGSLGFALISRAEMKKKYGLKCVQLYYQMMLHPKEDLFMLHRDNKYGSVRAFGDG